MPFKKPRFVAIIPLLIAAAAGLPSHGMPSSRVAQDTHADWTGFYRTARGKDLAGFQPLNLDISDVVTAHLEPWVRMKMEETNGVADDVGAVCQNNGIFRQNTSFLWLPAPDKIVLVWGQINVGGVRRIYLNRQHPKNLSFTWNGDSIGRWEGDTLVVDTVGFNDKSWLTTDMQQHTEELHVVERIRSVAKGLLEIESTVDDRKALVSPYTFTRYYKYSAPYMKESICNDGDPGEQEMWAGFRRRALKKRYIPPEQTKDKHSGTDSQGMRLPSSTDSAR